MTDDQGQTERAILLTGVYGTGKSAVGAEIADILERRDQPFALLDLDFLSWYHTPGSPGHDAMARRMLAANLRAVVQNYRAAGIHAFILAGWVQDRTDVDALSEALGAPVFTVRLTVRLAEIERRLGADVTTGRRDDLEEAARWLAVGRGAGIEDATVANEGPIRPVALAILELAGWGPNDRRDR